MSLDAPSVAACKLLDGQTLNGQLVQWGQNLFRGYVRAPSPDGVTVPNTALFVLARGGGRPVHYKNADGTKDRLFASVTLFVRADPNHFEDGEDLARAAWKLLQRNIPTGYVECHCLTSEPEYVGLDDTEHPIWTINLELVRTE